MFPPVGPECLEHDGLETAKQQNDQFSDQSQRGYYLGGLQVSSSLHANFNYLQICGIKVAQFIFRSLRTKIVILFAGCENLVITF